MNIVGKKFKRLAYIVVALTMTSLGYAEEVVKYDFTSKKMCKMVGLHHLKRLESEGSLKLEITGKDPFIVFPKPASMFSGKDFPFIKAEMKCSNLKRAKNQVYWTTESSKQWGGGKSLSFHVKSSMGNEYNIFTFDMSKNKKWADEKISDLRLDPFSAPIGSIIEIKWVNVTK